MLLRCTISVSEWLPVDNRIERHACPNKRQSRAYLLRRPRPASPAKIEKNRTL
jgi:hypothetical protein